MTEVGSLGRGARQDETYFVSRWRPYPAVMTLRKRALEKVADIDATMSAIIRFAQCSAKEGSIGNVVRSTTDCREQAQSGVASHEMLRLCAIAPQRCALIRAYALYSPALADAVARDRAAVSVRRSCSASLTVRLPSIISSQV